MNMHDNPTEADLREMLVLCDDENYRHVLWIGPSGNVHIEQVEDGQWFAFRDSLKAVSVGRSESFSPGNGYTGPNVSAETVRQLFRILECIWERSDRGRIKVGLVDFAP